MKSEKWFVCECESLEHFMVINYEPDFDDSVYISIHLSHFSLWKRIQMAIAYIFGYKSKYGNFEEILLNKTKLKELIDTLSGYHSYMIRNQQNINF